MRTALIPTVAVAMTLATQAGAWAQSFTSMQFSNATGSPVTAWLTLGANSAGTIANVALVDVGTGQQVPVSGSGLQGSFTLQGDQTVSWNSFNGGVATGSVTFRAVPQSCPTPGGPCGVTKGEFAINVGNEAVDVSSVDGINAIIAMDLSDGGATPWPSSPSGGQVAQNSGTLAGDKNAWGVFPYRCTQCAAIGDAPPTTCNPLGPAMPSYCKDGTESNPQPVVCQLNRNGAGGTVKFIFKGAADPQQVRGPAQGPIRGGTAIRVGAGPARDGSGRGSLKISGVFAFDGPVDLAAAGATVNLLAGLNERETGEDLVLDGVLTLAADARNTATTARFKTAAGETPAAALTIGNRGRGEFTLLLEVSRATIDVPGGCPQSELATVIELDDRTNPPLLIGFAQPWECLERGSHVEYLRTP